METETKKYGKKTFFNEFQEKVFICLLLHNESMKR